MITKKWQRAGLCSPRTQYTTSKDPEVRQAHAGSPQPTRIVKWRILHNLDVHNGIAECTIQQNSVISVYCICSWTCWIPQELTEMTPLDSRATAAHENNQTYCDTVTVNRRRQLEEKSVLDWRLEEMSVRRTWWSSRPSLHDRDRYQDRILLVWAWSCNKITSL